MTRLWALAAGLLTLTATAPLLAQAGEPAATQGLGEMLVSANRQGARFADANRPVVTLRRRADAAVMGFSITSDTRDAPTREGEVHKVLLTALDRAAAAGFELVTGTAQLDRVTRDNYKSLPFNWAGRADTGRIDVMLRTRLDGTAQATAKRLRSFIDALPGSGRASVSTPGGITLTVLDPDQYREAIVRLVAEDARSKAALFGPDFTYTVTGIDAAVSWSQASSTDLYLYLPYRYVIIPRQVGGGTGQ
jgi:hypothetical protein